MNTVKNQVNIVINKQNDYIEQLIYFNVQFSFGQLQSSLRGKFVPKNVIFQKVHS